MDILVAGGGGGGGAAEASSNVNLVNSTNLFYAGGHGGGSYGVRIRLFFFISILCHCGFESCVLSSSVRLFLCFCIEATLDV